MSIGEGVMADQIALKTLGLSFGAVTVAVMLIAAFVVKSHLDGRMSLDTAKLRVISTAVAGSSR